MQPPPESHVSQPLQNQESSQAAPGELWFERQFPPPSQVSGAVQPVLVPSPHAVPAASKQVSWASLQTRLHSAPPAQGAGLGTQPLAGLCTGELGSQRSVPLQ